MSMVGRATLAVILLTTLGAQGLLSEQSAAIAEKINLALPIVTAALLAIGAQANPIAKWATCRLAAHNVESELYRYRAQVGNYAEVYEKYIGKNTPIGLARGLNAQYTDGGILYAPPMR